jgi:glycosyltransferase involved in cell wall biosynthesis
MFYGVFFAPRFDVIYAYHPPLTIGVAASIIRFFRRRPMVYDIQDLWPDTLAATGMLTNVRVLRWVDLVCRWVYSQADHIAVLSPGFKTRLVSKGVPPEKLSVIYNWADESSLRAAAKKSFQPIGGEGVSGRRLTVLFAGNMGRAQGLESVLEAALILQKEGAPVHFRFVGGGLELDNLKSTALGLSLSNVQFIQPLPMSEIGGVIDAADVLLVHLRADPLFDITVPSKTQAYLCSGKPILMAVGGDSASLVELARAGVLAEPGNPESIADAVRRLLCMAPEERCAMGVRGRDFYDQNLSVKFGIDQFARLFQSVSFGTSQFKG